MFFVYIVLICSELLLCFIGHLIINRDEMRAEVRMRGTHHIHSLAEYNRP